MLQWSNPAEQNVLSMNSRFELCENGLVLPMRI
jgi:hypothetical protein